MQTIKLFTFIPVGEKTIDPNELTALGEKACLFVLENCIVLWVNSNNLCYWKTKSTDKESLLEELKSKNGDTLIMKEEGVGVKTKEHQELLRNFLKCLSDDEQEEAKKYWKELAKLFN